MNVLLLGLLNDKLCFIQDFIFQALTLQTILDASKQVLRQLLSSTKDKNQPVALDVCMLQFLYELLMKSQDEIEQVKNALMALLKDALYYLNLAPPSLFLMFAILNIYVQKVPIPEERRGRRDLQVTLTV